MVEFLGVGPLLQISSWCLRPVYRDARHASRSRANSIFASCPEQIRWHTPVPPPCSPLGKCEAFSVQSTRTLVCCGRPPVKSKRPSRQPKLLLHALAVRATIRLRTTDVSQARWRYEVRGVAEQRKPGGVLENLRRRRTGFDIVGSCRLQIRTCPSRLSISLGATVAEPGGATTVRILAAEEGLPFSRCLDSRNR